MDKTKSVNWKPEDNNYLNKVFTILNLVMAYMIILAPIITSVCCLLGMNMDVLNVYIIFYLFFILVRIFYISLNFRFFKFRKSDLLEILGLSLLAMLFISAIISNGLNASFVFAIGYFFVFLTFTRIDKKHYKALLYTFVLTIAVCSIMGICDLHNSYMPGFIKNTYPMSLQFYNSNYSGYITVMAVIMCIYILCNHKKLAEQIIFWTCFVVLNVALFINGCFSAETAMFVGELFLLIYLWIKNKKCPVMILGFLLISIASSFVWIKGVSTSNANYMYESLAVIDGKLHTHLVKDVSMFFDKLFGTGVIDGVLGSDGWDRTNLKAKAWKEITSSPQSILFGKGAGYNYNVLVHNVILQAWLEFGIINVLIYCSILVVLFVRIFKSKFTKHNLFLFTLMISVILVCHYFGPLDPYSFTYYICFLAVFVKDANGEHICKDKEENQSESVLNNEENQEDKLTQTGLENKEMQQNNDTKKLEKI